MMKMISMVMGIGLLTACGEEPISVRDAGAEDSTTPRRWLDGGALPMDASLSEGIQTDSQIDSQIDRGPADAQPTDGLARDLLSSDTLRPDLFVTDLPSIDTAPLGPLLIYLSPTGDDTKDGLSLQNAILSLNRAHTLLATRKPKRDVEIHIAAGTYYGQKVVWTYTMPGYQIRFMPLGGGTTRPVFDGCLEDNPANIVTGCPGGSWFILKHAKGEETNLRFDYIHVKRYQTAISLNGDRNDESTSNGSNTIYGCYFSDIGTRYQPGLAPSTAALRLVNSDDNVIANTHFVNIINSQQCGLLHAIYIAHLSERNQILRNRFSQACGDPIRLRDFSNENVINENTFTKTGVAAAYTDWYCDHDEPNNACTKVGPECPCWNNQFRDNTLDGNWSCAPLGTFFYFQDDTTTGCAPPSTTSKRLSTSGNTATSAPCSL